MRDLIAEILTRYPHDAWLKMKMAELDYECAQVSNDRNRLLADLSHARDKINQLEAGIHAR